MDPRSSTSLWQEARTLFPGGVNSPVRSFRAVGGEPFFARRAEGATLWDVDGRPYIDYVCSWGALPLGHAHPVVEAAVREALAEGTSFGVPSPREVRLAAKIRASVPSIEKLRMTSSGTEACMTAIRLARGFTGRDKILKFAGCYHGHSDSLLVKAGSGALTHGEPDSAGVPRPLAELTIVLPWNDAAAAQELLDREGGRIAAVILEPVPANAGLLPPRPGFLERIRELCDRHGIILIFDEVITGFRLGMGGAQERFGIRPDLTTFGKIVGGGLPAAALGGRAEILDRLAPAGEVYQAGTLSGNPLAMAAGLAQIEEMERSRAYERLEQLGAMLESEVRELLRRRAEKSVQFHRMASLFCFFFTDQAVFSLEDAIASDRKRFARFFHSLLRQGVFFPPSPFETCFLSTAHSEREIEKTVAAIGRALEESQ
ncbi:glutamate-1-semialdehyde aminotransferase (aminomutase) [Methylacidimicrobium sp. AP8]|uniref:glutamate-1-semialdehyde 2,1-aminomutase n=1 Tax=Methylacidimicrobium sp. AP8 TaxID=2730359 RepID=UPI0018C17F08|nr:glutamate-1-semialdehyde 2,1-aminomutase [Methylacidimicrobium sp. AP8]CAB4244338.1 glutamate-1-semialdehyde aminotransferase (aminomutase) [Methylacidimicrobium sp. AP8]